MLLGVRCAHQYQHFVSPPTSGLFVVAGSEGQLKAIAELLVRNCFYKLKQLKLGGADDPERWPGAQGLDAAAFGIIRRLMRRESSRSRFACNMSAPASQVQLLVWQVTKQGERCSCVR